MGWPWSVDSAFQFNFSDRGNIRFNPDLEPLGAIGDAGWYNMRAIVEYLSPDIELQSVSTFLRRDEETGVAIGGSGVMRFEDFLSSNPDGSASYTLHRGGFGPSATVETITSAKVKPGPALMFEDFAAMILDPAKMDRSIHASERTQELLDAAWNSGLDNEASNQSPG